MVNVIVDPQAAREALRPFFADSAESDGEQRMFCPLCEDPATSKSPSASLRADEGKWNCLKTADHGGSVYALLRHLRVSAPTQRNTSAHTTPKRSQPPKVSESLEQKAIQDWPAMLRDHPDSKVWKFLTGERGLTPETIHQHKLGMNSAGDLTIPVRNLAAVRNVRYRSMKAKAEPRYRHTKGHGSPTMLYPLRVLPGTICPVLVTESELCALLANQIGNGRFVAVTGTGGAGNLPADLEPLAGREVFIAYDHDDAGDAGAAKLATALRKIGSRAHIVNWSRLGLPAGDHSMKDFTDWVMKANGTADKLLLEFERLRADKPEADKAEFEADVSEALRRREVNREAERRMAENAARSAFEGFVSVSLREALAKPRERTPVLIERLQMQGHKATLTAGFKTGKTTLSTNVVRSMADRIPFLGEFDVIDLPGNVGIFDYELTENDALDLFGAIGIQNTERVVLESLRGTGFSFANEFHRELAARWLREHDIAYWVIDPFGRAVRGFGSENDNDDVRRFLDAIDEIIAETNVLGTLMPVHTGRVAHEVGAEHGRGATVVDDDADARWILTRDGVGRRFFRAEGRSGVGIDEVSLEFDPPTSLLSLGSVSREQSKGARLLPAVEAYLAENPGHGKNEIRDGVAGGNTQIDAAIALGIERGTIRVEDNGRGRSKPHFYEPKTKVRVGHEEVTS